MLYEGTISHEVIGDNGLTKTVKEKYILEEGDFFANAEHKLFEEFQGFNNLDVIAIKRSKIKEIANHRNNDNEGLWMAELQDVFHKDDGTKKILKYKIVFFSMTFDSAKAYIQEYAKQGFDMTLVSLKLTDFIDVIE